MKSTVYTDGAQAHPTEPRITTSQIIPHHEAQEGHEGGTFRISKSDFFLGVLRASVVRVFFFFGCDSAVLG